MNIYTDLAEKIIQAQERVIGPLAIEQAQKVHGLTIDWTKKEVTIQGNSSTVLEQLVKQYEHLFGQTSVEVCKDAVKGMIDDVPKDQVPPVLAA